MLAYFYFITGYITSTIATYWQLLCGWWERITPFEYGILGILLIIWSWFTLKGVKRR